MGADIYLMSIYERNKAEHKPAFDDAVARRNATSNQEEAERIQGEVERHHDAMYAPDGYFRDSYNQTALFWLIDLSWWNDAGDMLDDEGHLPIDQAKEMREIVARARIDIDLINEKLPDAFPASTREEVVEFFTKKRDRFVALLDKSIELNEPLRCSI